MAEKLVKQLEEQNNMWKAINDCAQRNHEVFEKHLHLEARVSKIEESMYEETDLTEEAGDGVPDLPEEVNVAVNCYYCNAPRENMFLSLCNACNKKEVERVKRMTGIICFYYYLFLFYYYIL